MTGAPKTILLVEDEESVRTIAARLLSRAGFRVLAASGPREARALFDQHTSDIDLLLTDVVMPEMNGPLLAERLLETRAGLPVLFMSGYSHVNASELSSHPNTAFLPKPFTAAGLSGAVNELLSRGTPA